MTRVFVYEYCTALGLGRDATDPAHSLFREGMAMRDAVLADLNAIPGVEADAFPDDAAPVIEDEWIHGYVSTSDWNLFIAPETDRTLEFDVQRVTEWHGRLLGPAVDAIILTSDKLALSRHWQRNGVPTPRTWELTSWTSDRFPVVWKPRDGAGSTAIYRLDGAADIEQCKRTLFEAKYGGELIAQDFVPGRPASVAFLVGPLQTISLLPTFQLLSADGRFRYEGGELPIRPDLAARAVALGRRAIGCVPGLFGYVGVDLVLGDAPDGSQDFAIEINPRLTTSYVGLRALAGFNLAETMLRVAEGSPVAEPRWKAGRVRFRPDGIVYTAAGGDPFG